MISLHVPALRERPADIPLLASFLLQRMALATGQAPHTLHASALEDSRWNKTAAAKILGISFRSLRYRLNKLDIN